MTKGWNRSLKAVCCNCKLEDDHEKLWNHCKKEKHVMADGWPNFEFIDDSEIVRFYKDAMKIVLLNKMKRENPEYLIEEIECDMTKFKHIHNDLTDNALSKYGKRKMLLEVIDEIVNDKSPKESTK